MNEMMEGWRVERKNRMVQSELATVIPPPPPPAVAAGPVCQQPGFTAANQQAGEELDATQMDE